MQVKVDGHWTVSTFGVAGILSQTSSGMMRITMMMVNVLGMILMNMMVAMLLLWLLMRTMLHMCEVKFLGKGDKVF